MVDANFGRTQSGKANKPYFVGKVIVYVEGDDDVTFFAPLRHRLDVKFESANGKSEALKLAARAARKASPFVVVLDDDFDGILGNKIEAECVVYVGRYSIENLVANDDVLLDFVQGYCGDNADVPADSLMREVWAACGERLSELVVTDLAAAMGGVDRGGVPERIETWIEPAGRKIRVRDAAWEEFKKYAKMIDPELKSQAKDYFDGIALSDICENHLRGHLVFGLIRNRVLNAVRRIKGSSCVADNRILLSMLSEIFWRRGDCSQSLYMKLEAARQVAVAII